MTRRKRIKPVSDKLAVAKRAYNARVREWLKGKPCAVFPQFVATQVHHRFGRSGRLLLWEPGWLAVSSAGHALIHSNVAMARERGFIGPLGTWNDFAKALQSEV